MLNQTKGAEHLCPPSWTPYLNTFSIEACWKLGKWDTLESYLSLPHIESFEVKIGKLLLATRQENNSLVDRLLKESRDSLSPLITAASVESYRRSYPYLLQLHMLREIESANFLMKQIKLPSHQPERHHQSCRILCQMWNVRLTNVSQSYKVSEPFLNLHRILLRDILYVLPFFFSPCRSKFLFLYSVHSFLQFLTYLSYHE